MSLSITKLITHYESFIGFNCWNTLSKPNNVFFLSGTEAGVVSDWHALGWWGKTLNVNLLAHSEASCF